MIPLECRGCPCDYQVCEELNICYVQEQKYSNYLEEEYTKYLEEEYSKYLSDQLNSKDSSV